MNINIFLKTIFIKIPFLEFTCFERQNHYKIFKFDRIKVKFTCDIINNVLRIYFGEKEDRFIESRIFSKIFVLKKLNNIIKHTVLGLSVL